MEQDSGLRLGEIIHRAFIAIKRKIVLILAIILVITGGGVIIANVRKPMYTAGERADYYATSSAESLSDVSSVYFNTIVDFCKAGCVVDRANFYYDCFIHRKTEQTLNDFIKEVEDAVPGDPLYYDTSKMIDVEHILKNQISVTVKKSNNNTSYMLVVKYSDLDSGAAVNKVKILLKAIEKEANLTTDEEGTDYKYFGVPVVIQDWGDAGFSSDWSKSRIISISLVIGIIVALLAVYAVNALDRTVKEKAELERITGVSVLAFIEDQEA